MKNVVALVLLFFNYNYLFAQQDHANEEVVTKQCSAIRELVYAAVNGQFEPIKMEQVRGSEGFQTRGTWRFSTTRYNTSMQWQGANTSYLEHFEESTDSSHTNQWQYIAEYSHVPNVLEAERLYRQLNSQVAGCPYVINDSIDLQFIALPPEKLPVERPSSLEIASLYELPLEDSINQNKVAAISVMIGMEKRLKDYRVSLIVETVKGD
ncbi:MAG: hypothetical protein V4717_06340 [Bacteroidota bacterium]